MLKHLLTPWNLNIKNSKIRISREWKEFLKWNKKHFLQFHDCSLWDLKKTSKNVVDTTFKLSFSQNIV